MFGLRRGPSSPLHQAPPKVNNIGPNLLQVGYYPVAWLLERFIGAILAELLWPSAGFSPYGYIHRYTSRSRLLCSHYGRRPKLFFMVIATDDAVRDLWVLDHALRALNSEAIHFTGLGGWITLEDIETEIKKLRKKSEKTPGSQIVILLTGHGDKGNRMMLPMSKFIDAAYIFKLLLEPHETRSKIPITVLFDICRPSGDPGSVPPEGISTIWTCSPGQVAGAFRLPYGPDSCFLSAMMMASRESDFSQAEKPPQELVQVQLERVMEYLKELDSIKHSKGGCKWCWSGQGCYRPTSQTDTDGLLRLTKVLSGTEVAEGVHQWFTGDFTFCKVNGIELPQGPWERIWGLLRRADGRTKLGSPLVAPTPAPNLDPSAKGHTSDCDDTNTPGHMHLGA
ncbi:unnamed protein product [Rhizoctonia solani]|uniref:Uncharacterized protein n=1 Tax=Rhizoctonia solani TaxID=456999 RepID=A0A8H2WYA5_9AGAM|nr:unnamed protein product [Rhizoctonia solani]